MAVWMAGSSSAVLVQAFSRAVFLFFFETVSRSFVEKRGEEGEGNGKCRSACRRRGGKVLCRDSGRVGSQPLLSGRPTPTAVRTGTADPGRIDELRPGRNRDLICRPN